MKYIPYNYKQIKEKSLAPSAIHLPPSAVRSNKKKVLGFKREILIKNIIESNGSLPLRLRSYSQGKIKTESSPSNRKVGPWNLPIGKKNKTTPLCF